MVTNCWRFPSLLYVTCTVRVMYVSKHLPVINQLETINLMINN